MEGLIHFKNSMSMSIIYYKQKKFSFDYILKDQIVNVKITFNFDKKCCTAEGYSQN